MSDGGPSGLWQSALNRYLSRYLQTSPETLMEIFGRSPFSDDERKLLAEFIKTGFDAVEPLPVREAWFSSGRISLTGQKIGYLSKLVIAAVCKYVEGRWPDYWIVRMEIDSMPDFDSIVSIRIETNSYRQDGASNTLTFGVGVAINPNQAPYVGKVYPTE